MGFRGGYRFRNFEGEAEGEGNQEGGYGRPGCV